MKILPILVGEVSSAPTVSVLLVESIYGYSEFEDDGRGKHQREEPIIR